MTVINADGEPLVIQEVMVDGVGRHQLTGTYTILADAQQSAAGCTECVCSFGSGPCTPGFSFSNCSSTGSSCNQWPCASSGGGGVVSLELDITAMPGA
jgi:hypothetical protein